MMTDDSAADGTPEAVHFNWVDVFADQPLAGSPVPVVSDADPLSDDMMRAIAREFNHAATTFILRPTLADADRRFRSFTPTGAEVPGSGHHVLGAWIWLAATDWLSSRRDTFVQQVGERLTPVTITSRGVGRASVTVPQGEARFVRTVAQADAPAPSPARESLARSLGLGASEPLVAAEVVSTGVPHLLVRAVDAATVDACAPDGAALREILTAVGAEGCCVYAARESPRGAYAQEASNQGASAQEPDAYAQFFHPTTVSVEEPASASAAGSLAALLVRDRLIPPGEPVRIEQGTTARRRCVIDVRVDADGVEISANGVVSAGGTLWLP